MSAVEAFDFFAASIAKIDPSQIAQLQAPESMNERVRELIYKKKNEQISIDESTELDRYLALDLIISLSKARAAEINHLPC